MKNRKANIKQHWFSLMILLFISNVAFLQSTSFTTKVSHTKVGVDDNFTVTYTANKKGQFTGPNFKDFDASGPSQGTNTSISIVNGQMTQNNSYSYTYTLNAKKTGEFMIPGAKIKIGNAIFESKPVKVTVVKESQVQQRQRRSLFDDFDDFFGQSRRNTQPQTIDDKAFFAKTIVSKSNVYEGEHLVVSYKLYSRGLAIQLEDYNFPTHEGFWTENIELPQNLKPEIEIIDGQQYQVYTVRKEVLFPQRSGEIKIAPFDVTARINQSFFNSGIQKKVTSNSVTIKSKALPLGAPDNFENQVGDYSFQVEVKADTIKVDEPIDVKVLVKGKGNLKQLGQLNLEFPTNFETYDPTVKDRLAVNGGGISGTKEFNYLVIPRKAGTYEFGPLSFSYFDLKTEKYKTLSSDKFKIVVLNTDGSVEDRVVHSSNKSVTINEEINDIEQTTNLAQKGNYFFNSWGYYGLIFGVGALFFLFLVVNKKWEENSADTIENRIKKARKKLEKRMALAKGFMEDGNKGAFYSETIKSLYQYVSDKFQMETSQMSKQNIQDRLEANGVSSEVSSSFIKMLEDCEMAQYASLSNISEREVYEKSLNVIEKIENQFKV